MSQKWSIQSIRLQLGESDFALTCINCRRTTICLNCITSWVKLTNPISYQDSFFMAASPQLNKSGAFQICIKDCYIKVEHPFFLMQICKVKCHSCKIDLGIFLKTVNQEEFFDLEGCVLLKSDKLCDIQPFKGLITMIKQNAQVQLSKVEKNSSLQSSNIGAIPIISYNQSVFQNIILFSKHLRQLQYRTVVLETIENVQEKIAKNEGLFELQGLNQYQKFNKINSINPFTVDDRVSQNQPHCLQHSGSSQGLVQSSENSFHSSGHSESDSDKTNSSVNQSESQNDQTTFSIEQVHSQSNQT